MKLSSIYRLIYEYFQRFPEISRDFQRYFGWSSNAYEWNRWMIIQRIWMKAVDDHPTPEISRDIQRYPEISRDTLDDHPTHMNESGGWSSNAYEWERWMIIQRNAQTSLARRVLGSWGLAAWLFRMFPITHTFSRPFILRSDFWLIKFYCN